METLNQLPVLAAIRTQQLSYAEASSVLHLYAIVSRPHNIFFPPPYSFMEQSRQILQPTYT